jgi:hydrogenase maturation protease
VRAKLPEALAIGLATLGEWGVPGTPRAPGEVVPLLDPSLGMDRYEGERPDAGDACRVGDARFLAMRAAQDG